MTEPDASKLDVGKDNDVRSIAVLMRKANQAGAGLPGVVWLGGYRSDMTGSKAEALCRQKMRKKTKQLHKKRLREISETV